MSSEKQTDINEKMQKNWTTALLLSVFLGSYGIDRFYLGKVKTRFLKLITAGGLGVWYLYDVALILTGEMKDENEKPLKNRRKSWIINFFLILGFGLLDFVLFWDAFSGHESGVGVDVIEFIYGLMFGFFVVWLLSYSIVTLIGKEDKAIQFLKRKEKKKI